MTINEKNSNVQAIAKHKKAEEKVSEATFRSVFENSIDAILLTKPDGTVLHANDAACRMYGMSEDELKKVGRSGILVLDEKLIAALEERKRTGKTHAELTHRRKDGTTFQGEVTSSVFTDADGTVKTSMIVRDITERKKAEEALSESEGKYRSLFNSIDEGFCIIEMIFDANCKPTDYRILDVNYMYEKQTGLHDVVGKLVSSIVPNLEAHWFTIYGEIALNGKPKRFENESKAMNRYYDVYAFPLGKKRPYQLGVLFKDITERKKAEEALKQSENKLEEYNKNLEKLVEERTKQLKDSERLATIGATAGMVGHDIRNPLQAITSDVYLAKTDLAETPDSEEKKNVLESLIGIEDNVVYINKIVQDLQDFARPLQPIAEGTNIENLCQEVLLKNNIPNNITTSCTAEKEAKQVMADPDLLKRVITNLVINAVQAMPQGGKLSLYTYRKEGGLVIEVQDTGVGIPEEVRGKLFTPMFTTKAKGQGFGLAAVKRVTESMNGTISFESEKGIGTKFIVRLPPPKELNGKWTFK